MYRYKSTRGTSRANGRSDGLKEEERKTVSPAYMPNIDCGGC
jgi:hypothetical protein